MFFDVFFLIRILFRDSDLRIWIFANPDSDSGGKKSDPYLGIRTRIRNTAKNGAGRLVPKFNKGLTRQGRR